MATFPARTTGSPLALSASTESQVYGLFAFAIGLTLVGAWFGLTLNASGALAGASLLFVMLELLLILTSPLWSRVSPLNYVLFAVFPLLSGFTVMPYILYVLRAYENGPSIVINALSATVCMVLAGAVAVRLLKWNFSALGRTLFFAVIGLFVLGLLQIFVPSMRSTQMELLLSGGGVVVFALFTAYDLQRIQTLGRAGANPFMLALSLYLDIFNLFLYLLRFMGVVSGNRR